MKKINILESLLELDKKSSNRYELATLYEACKLEDKDKEQLVKYIDSYEHPSLIGQFLESKCDDSCNKIIDDDCVEETDECYGLTEEVVLDTTRDTDRYVWNKIKNIDALTDDDSMYWDFDRSIRQGDKAQLVTDESDVPESANYKFSFVELDMNFFYSWGTETWYVVDKTYVPKNVEETIDIRSCPSCGRRFAANELQSGRCPKCSEKLRKTDSGDYVVADRDNIEEAWEPKFDDTWKPEDIELWKSIDWKARDYMPYVNDSHTFKADVVAYGLPGGEQHATATFAKHLYANSIYPPIWEPIDDPFKGKGTVGYMYDGHKHDGYLIMDRTETQEVYDLLSESLNSNDRVSLYYDDLTITVQDPDGDEYEHTSNYTFIVPINDVIEVLRDRLMTDADVPGGLEAFDDESVEKKFFDEHFDEMLSKYEDGVLEYFKDLATEDFEAKYSYEDWKENQDLLRGDDERDAYLDMMSQE